MSFDDTRTLLAGARAGEPAALEELVERYGPRLLGRIRLMMGERARHAAESVDFLQGILTEVARDSVRFECRDEGHFLRWATEVARNDIRDVVKKRREQAFESMAGASAAPAEPAAASQRTTPSVAAERNEEQHALADALEALPAESRTVIELREFEGLSFREIGDRMDRSENAAQLLHTRSVVRLGRLLRGGGSA